MQSYLMCTSHIIKIFYWPLPSPIKSKRVKNWDGLLVIKMVSDIPHLGDYTFSKNHNVQIN